MKKKTGIVAVTLALVCTKSLADEWPKPYSPPCVERENVFEFAEKPMVKLIGNDRYEITFAVKGWCDVAAGIVDEDGVVVRHLGAGVLGSNAPPPFQKDSLRQTLVWNGKDDLDIYHKHPERLKVRVMLGLKPVFDKRLGGSSPYNLPGEVWGLATDATGAYVFCGGGGGFAHCTVRKFDRDGGYVSTVFPPPVSIPLEKSAGMGFVEYERDKRARHGADLGDSLAGNGGVMLGVDGVASPRSCQAAVVGNRILYASFKPGAIRYIYTDGSTDVKGQLGMPFVSVHGLDYSSPFLAASPDGKWVYAISIGGGAINNAVARAPTDGSSATTMFIGTPGKPGSAEGQFNVPAGIDCDAQGRIYVSDSNNNRVQVFSSEGKFLKAIRVDRPGLLRVHQQTGAIYVQHPARVEGRSIDRLTKFVSFDNPTEEFHADGFVSVHMALDSWSAKPRLWLTGEPKTREAYSNKVTQRHSLRIVQEEGKALKVMLDFGEEARKEAGANYIGRWAGDCFDKVVCDPLREHAYYRNSTVFDLKTGARIGSFAPARHCVFDDMAFDKAGYAHLHFNPTFFGQGVGRVDPSRAPTEEKARGTLRYPECPYDYGVQAHEWNGILPTKDQGGAKGFQDGIGVNMRGDVASECNIYYVPKWEDEVREEALAGNEARLKAGVWSEEQNTYNAWQRSVQEALRRGDEVHAIRHRPGIPLSGGTVWVYDRTGEIRRESAVIAGDLINGVQIDEDRAVYFVNARPKVYAEKPFLYGKGGILGTDKRSHPFTGTLVKSKPDQPCRVLLARAKVPMQPLPERPPDMMALDRMEDAYMGKGSWCWVDGGEWVYAGAGPITSTGCSCPRQHLGLDWYRRTYLPEAYRHSIGILDTNGNLIMHLGEYGNFDDAPGGRNSARPGGADIRIMQTRFISATDNYLVYGDWAEKLVVLKLTYHAEATADIRAK